MIKKIIILTGNELRHAFFRMNMAKEKNIKVIHSYCEGLEKSLGTLVEKEENNKMRKKHLENREQSERKFFSKYVADTLDLSSPIFIPKGEINNPIYVNEIIGLKPDIVIAYGSSIIREPLLNAFIGRFLNVHLGLSPYYRGSGTNYWPLVNGEPEYVGATFMHIDPGIDTGEIIHQIRVNILPKDDPSIIGNRLITDMIPVYAEIIRKIDELPKIKQPSKPFSEKFYKQKDYSEESVIKLYNNFKNNMISNYIIEKKERCAKVPIIENPLLYKSTIAIL